MDPPRMNDFRENMGLISGILNTYVLFKCERNKRR